MARLALVLGIVTAADVVLAPAFAHFGVLAPLRAFMLWLASALPGLIAVVLGVITLATGGGAARGVPAIALGATGLAVVGLLISGARGAPRLNDVSTDLEDPPAFVEARELPANAGRDMGYPDAFREPVRRAYPDVKPVLREESAQALYERALSAAKSTPDWRITASDPAALRFEAVATSNLWRFQDDVAVRVRDEGGGRARLDVRSKSRDGQGDFGANAARIRAFTAKL